MKNTNKISKQRKLIFIFLLILGNAMMALLTFPSEPEGKARPEKVYRPNYVNIRIKAILKAELDPTAPVTLLGKNTRSLASSAFILKQYPRPQGPEAFLKGESFEEFLVSAPKSVAEKLLNDDVYLIYPSGIEISRKERKRYEVIY